MAERIPKWLLNERRWMNSGRFFLDTWILSLFVVGRSDKMYMHRRQLEAYLNRLEAQPSELCTPVEEKRMDHELRSPGS